jgi:6-phosphogluconolactonase (cycloisomerase 2 family)
MIAYNRISASGVYGQVYGTTNGAVATGAATTRVKVFTFDTPQLLWEITHDYKTRKVSVTLLDENYTTVYAGVEADTDGHIMVYFTEPAKGSAVVTFVL